MPTTSKTSTPAEPSSDVEIQAAVAPAKRKLSKRARIIIAAGIAALVVAGATFGGIAFANNVALTNAQDAFRVSQDTLYSQVGESVQARNELHSAISKAATFKTAVEKLITDSTGAVNVEDAEAVTKSLEALGKAIDLEGSAALTSAAASGGNTTDELIEATEKANTLIEQRDESIAATDAKTVKVNDAIAATQALVLAVAESVPDASKALLAGKTSADEASKTAFDAATKDVAAAVKDAKPADILIALDAYAVAAKALTASHDAALAAAQAQAIADAQANGSGSYVNPRTGETISTPPANNGGGSGCYGNQEFACVKTPPKFTSNELRVPNCDGFPYGSHTVGYGGTSVISFTFPWDAYVSGPTVYFIVCL